MATENESITSREQVIILRCARAITRGHAFWDAESQTRMGYYRTEGEEIAREFESYDGNPSRDCIAFIYQVFNEVLKGLPLKEVTADPALLALHAEGRGLFDKWIRLHTQKVRW